VLNLSQEIPFLSQSLTFTLTYLWSRRNPSLRMSFLGLFTFNAPYLPWTLIGFTVVLHSVIPWADMLGFVVGHLYFYLEDVYPSLPLSQGQRVLKTPEWFVNLVQQRVVAPVEPIPEIRMEELVGNVE
jgi:Derlin-2/3